MIEACVWPCSRAFRRCSGAGSDECTVDTALLDSGDVLICTGDPETPESMRGRFVGDVGHVVVAQASDEPTRSGPPILAPDPTGFQLAKLTTRRTYEVVDALGSDLSGTIEVVGWNGDAHLSDEHAAPVCLDPSPGRPQLFQCDLFGETHPDERFPQVVLFLVNDPAGLVLYRWGRLDAGTVVVPGGSAQLESLRL